jgi:hypothetical protein
MSTINATLSLQTSDIFPDPVSLTVVAASQVNLNADFASEVLPVNKKVSIYGPSQKSNPSGTTYIYLKSISTNTSKINVYLVDKNSTEVLAMSLWPDDFAWFPLLDDAQVVSVKVLNTSTNTTAKLDYFFGERG